MAYSHTTTTPIPAQQKGGIRRSQSDLDWNAPKTPRTPRSEYAFMQRYAVLCGTKTPSPFGPLSGGVAQ